MNDFSKKHNKQMICAYDEFGVIKKFVTKRNLIKLFRSKIQHRKNTTFIFSGSLVPVMKNMFVTSKLPFYRLARIYLRLAIQQIVLFNPLNGRLSNLLELKEIILATEKDFLEKVWGDISGNREYVYVLRAITEDSKNTYKRPKHKNINISRAINKQERMGLLFKNNKTGYYITDPFSNYWISKNIQI